MQYLKNVFNLPYLAVKNLLVDHMFSVKGMKKNCFHLMSAFW